MAKCNLGLLQVILSFFQTHWIGNNRAHAFEGLIKQGVCSSCGALNQGKHALAWKRLRCQSGPE